MSTQPLSLAFWAYDRVQPLVDGRVKIEGAECRFHSGRIVTEIFERMIRGREFDVAELGLTYYLRTLEFDDPPFVALPVFVNRAFRHSAIYVNKASGIREPGDLVGKTIGELALYGHDSGVTPKGILSDEYGVKPQQSRWIVGGIDFAMKPIDFVPQPHPADVDVSWADAKTDLGQKLVAGEIDALVSADVPRSVLEGAPEVGRLFEDYEAVERAWFRRTGIFPIMHTVVVRRDLARSDPELVMAIYRGLCEAKDETAGQLRRMATFNNMGTMVPWFNRLVAENRGLMGEDWWPYGIAANRQALDTYLRWHFEQGLTRRPFACQDLFVPELMET